MKQYLLTEDQIERMLACAIRTGSSLTATGAGHESYHAIPRWFKSPDKATHEMAIGVFKVMQQNEIIEPINQN